jgi:hypothetical protein
VADALLLQQVAKLEGELVLGDQLLQLDRGGAMRRRVAQHLLVLR